MSTPVVASPSGNGSVGSLRSRRGGRERRRNRVPRNPNVVANSSSSVGSGTTGSGNSGNPWGNSGLDMGYSATGDDRSQSSKETYGSKDTYGSKETYGSRENMLGSSGMHHPELPLNESLFQMNGSTTPPPPSVSSSSSYRQPGRQKSIQGRDPAAVMSTIERFSTRNLNEPRRANEMPVVQEPGMMQYPVTTVSGEHHIPLARASGGPSPAPSRNQGVANYYGQPSNGGLMGDEGTSRSVYSRSIHPEPSNVQPAAPLSRWELQQQREKEKLQGNISSNSAPRPSSSSSSSAPRPSQQASGGPSLTRWELQQKREQEKTRAAEQLVARSAPVSRPNPPAPPVERHNPPAAAAPPINRSSSYRHEQQYREPEMSRPAPISETVYQAPPTSDGGFGLLTEHTSNRHLDNSEDLLSESMREFQDDFGVDLEEQRRIMQQLEEAKQSKEAIARQEQEAASEMSQRQRHPSMYEERQRQEEEQLDQGTMIDVAPGIRLPLRSAEENWKAIKEGRVIVAKCICCAQDLTIMDESEFLLCADCWVFTPLEDGAPVPPPPPLQERRSSGVTIGVKEEDIMEWLQQEADNFDQGGAQQQQYEQQAPPPQQQVGYQEEYHFQPPEHQPQHYEDIPLPPVHVREPSGVITSYRTSASSADSRSSYHPGHPDAQQQQRFSEPYGNQSMPPSQYDQYDQYGHYDQYRGQGHGDYGGGSGDPNNGYYESTGPYGDYR